MTTETPAGRCALSIDVGNKGWSFASPLFSAWRILVSGEGKGGQKWLNGNIEFIASRFCLMQISIIR
jgi:hypothetical protein